MPTNSVDLSVMARTLELFDPTWQRMIKDAMPRSRKWAQTKLTASIPLQPASTTVIEGVEATNYLETIRDGLIAQARPVINDFSPARWLWYLRRTDPEVVRGYLPNTEFSILRIAENLTGTATLLPVIDCALTTNPLVFETSWGPMAKLARILAISELINHVEGGLRRCSKGTRFIVQENSFPDIELDEELEEVIDVFDRRVLKSLEKRWHPLISDRIAADGQEPLLAFASKYLQGPQDTPMWKGALTDHPTFFRALGVFSFNVMRLNDPEDAALVQGSLGAMQRPQVAASLVILSQAVMWHATWYSESVGVSVPRVGYVLMDEEQLIHHIDTILDHTKESTWPVMLGHVPADAKSVLEVLYDLDDGDSRSMPGPILRPWTIGVMIDLFALANALTDDLRVDSRVGGEWVNASALEFELAVQKLIDEAALQPIDAVRQKRGVPLKLNGSTITDADALMAVDDTLILIDCKKYELNQTYDSGDYASVRNAQSKVEEAVRKWEERLATIRQNPRGDNYDFSHYNYFYGLVITPGVVFTRSPETITPQPVGQTKVSSPAYLAFGELTALIRQFGGESS